MNIQFDNWADVNNEDCLIYTSQRDNTFDLSLNFCDNLFQIQTHDIKKIQKRYRKLAVLTHPDVGNFETNKFNILVTNCRDGMVKLINFIDDPTHNTVAYGNEEHFGAYLNEVVLLAGF